MRPALRRSITFWSGILVMIFILWAWVDSMNYVSAWHSYRGATRIVGVRHVAGRLSYEDVTGTNPAAGAMTKAMFPTGFDRHKTYHHQAIAKSDLMPAPQLIPRREILPVSSTDHVDSLIWILPHWVMLIGMGALWAALLLWRARRRRKAVALT